ncbi:FACE1 [Symbiodinium microadriaticum]|nr:FACE1 [Symbiodinium microadriaticum]
MMAVYPTVIAPLFNKYTKLDEGPIYTAIEKLASQVAFPLTQIYVVDGSKRSAHSNAYFYGFFGNKRIVLFDTLIEQVDLSELLSILGHEIGHWRLWHTLQGFLISQVNYCNHVDWCELSNNLNLVAICVNAVVASRRPPSLHSFCPSPSSRTLQASSRTSDLLTPIRCLC